MTPAQILADEVLRLALSRLKDCGAIRIRCGGQNDVAYSLLAAAGMAEIYREGADFFDVRLVRNSTITDHGRGSPKADRGPAPLSPNCGAGFSPKVAA